MTAWMRRAACRAEPDLWFSEDTAEIAHAQAICGTCPVRLHCHLWTLRHQPSYGVWAGEDREDREGRLSRDELEAAS